MEPLQPRHHHIEQDDVGQLGIGELQSGRPVIGRDDLEILARQLGFEELDVEFDVVDDEDARSHGNSACSRETEILRHQARKRSTVRRKLATEIGLAIYASQPPPRIFSSSPFIANAVTAMTGIERRSSSSLSHLVTSSPEISGSWISIRMRSGRCSRAILSASTPSRVCSVW